MPTGNGAPFHVDRFAKVDEQLKALAASAKAKGQAAAFLTSLKKVIGHLKADPLQWGDPLYHTKKAGGIVRRGTVFPLLVHYVVYEVERVVQILDVRYITLD